MTILLILAAALVIFLISVDPSWSNVLSTQRNNLVFEGRNMNYGAYTLRREQPRNMFIALTIVLGLTGAGSAAAMFFTNAPEEIASPSSGDVITVFPPPLDIPDDDPKKDDREEKPQDKAPKAQTSGIDNTEPIVTTDDKVKSMASQDDLSGKRPGPPGDGEIDGFEEPVKNGGGTGGTGSGIGTRDDEPVVPDKMPEFPGGEAALMAYMAERVDFGPMDIERGVSGTIHMSFTVLADGSITDIKTERGIRDGENLEKKAVLAIQKMPVWKPGIKGGKPVAVRFRIPLKFILRS